MLQLHLMKIAKNRKRNSGARTARQRDLIAGRRSGSKGMTEAERQKRRRIADSVRLYTDSKKISRAKLEEMVGRRESTMNHFFAGDFSDSLLARVEYILGRSFGGSSSVAPVEWGEYTQEGTAKFAGSYLTLRFDFENHEQVCAYVTNIEWGSVDQAQVFEGQLVQKPKIDGHGLIFREERRAEKKYTHRGQVWFPGHFLYLVTAYGDGRLRAAIVSLPDDGRMNGIQLSLYNPMGSAFVPAVSPVVLLRREKISDEELGNILPGHNRYQEYRQVLVDAMQSVVFAAPIMTPSVRRSARA